jgi:hypothetical protein
LAEPAGPESNQEAVDVFDDPFGIAPILRAEELEGVSVPGTRLATGKPRWVCRFFMFTYSQSGPNWPVEEFKVLVALLGGKCHIGHERHLDGGHHFHCLVDFERKWEFENPHRFCVGNRGSRPPSASELASGVLCPGQTHANILRVSKTPFHCWDYVSKYGDIVFSDLERPVVRGPNTTRDDNYKGSRALATKKEFLADIASHSPRDSIVLGGAIRQTAEIIYGKDKLPPQRQDNVALGLTIHWDRYPRAREWFIAYFPDPIPVIQATSREGAYTAELRTADEAALALRGAVKKRPHSLIVYGGTRKGKTLFSRALGPNLFFRGTFNLKTLVATGLENVDYMVWDDVSWKDSALKNDNYKNWMGGQDDFTVTDKYEGKVDITWGKPSIFCSNHNPLKGLPAEDQAWLKGNCTIINLGRRSDIREEAIAEGTVFT